MARAFSHPAWKVISEIVSSGWEYVSGFVILLNVITIGFEAELSLEVRGGPATGLQGLRGYSSH